MSQPLDPSPNPFFMKPFCHNSLYQAISKNQFFIFSQFEEFCTWTFLHLLPFLHTPHSLKESNFHNSFCQSHIFASFFSPCGLLCVFSTFNVSVVRFQKSISKLKCCYCSNQTCQTIRLVQQLFYFLSVCKSELQNQSSLISLNTTFNELYLKCNHESQHLSVE